MDVEYNGNVTPESTVEAMINAAPESGILTVEIDGSRTNQGNGDQ